MKKYYGGAVVCNPMHAVVEMPSCLADAEKLFSSAERAAIIDRLATDPLCGVWEQGRRQPERSARILLKVVEKEPEAVMRALAKSA